MKETLWEMIAFFVSHMRRSFSYLYVKYKAKPNMAIMLAYPSIWKQEGKDSLVPPSHLAFNCPRFENWKSKEISLILLNIIK